MSSPIEYSTSKPVSVEEFKDLLRRSTLGERRPIDDDAALQQMLTHANLVATAWDDKRLIGIARSVTDFAFCCYLSDLAVDIKYQRQGIGREMVARTNAELGPKAKLILLAAPAAAEYYPRIGFERHPSAWVWDKASPRL